MKVKIFVSSKFNTLDKSWSHIASHAPSQSATCVTEVEIELNEPDKKEAIEAEIKEFELREQYAKENAVFWANEIVRLKGELK